MRMLCSCCPYCCVGPLLQAMPDPCGASPGRLCAAMPPVDEHIATALCRATICCLTAPAVARRLPAVMSSLEEHGTVAECVQSGAEEYLVKPVTRKDVQLLWQHLLRKQVRRRQPACLTVLLLAHLLAIV